ncbi:hypothetical protein B484DRAFT_441974 [Ochromonadaceae sp. CCMP2298]|nr:hypothetical protein B484DRAFT_441974 [Ochromonadaceae sp. CCMP2298]
MEQVQSHLFRVEYLGPFVMYMFGVQRAPLLTPNGTYNRAAVRDMIRACGQDDPPAHFLAIPNNIVHSLNPDLLFFLLIRNADDDNDVFANAPDIPTMRNNWGLLYCNMSNLRLRAAFTGVNDNSSVRRWPANAIYHGMVHMTGVNFTVLPGGADVNGDGEGVGEVIQPDFAGLLQQIHNMDMDQINLLLDAIDTRVQALKDTRMGNEVQGGPYLGESRRYSTRFRCALLQQINALDLDQFEILLNAINTLVEQDEDEDEDEVPTLEKGGCKGGCGWM